MPGRIPKKSSVRALAKKLGVSPMTVSRALNDSAPVEAGTRKAVLDAALKAGYRKNQATGTAPLALWCGRSQIEGEHREEVLYYAQILFHVRSALEAHGAQCRLVEHPDDHPGAFLAARLILSSRSEDLALPRPDTSPCTRIGLDVENPHGPSVRLDGAQAAELAASRLEQLGHRHVAVYSSMDEGHQGERVEAFRRRFASRAGQTVTLVDARKKAPDGGHLLRHFLSNLPGRITAFYAPGGYFTLALLEALASKGLKVPHQFGVLGFDNFAFYRHLALAVDRIHADLDLMARVVADYALRALDGGPLLDCVKTLVPAKYIPGESLLPVSEMTRPIPAHPGERHAP